MSASTSASYPDVARTPPGSQPSNLQTHSMNKTPSSMTDTLYCTVDTSNVKESQSNKANPGTIRQEIEKEMLVGGSADNWRCMAVTKDRRNMTRIRTTCRDEAEVALVKEVAQKTAARGARTPRPAVPCQGGQRQPHGHTGRSRQVAPRSARDAGEGG